MGEIPFVGIGQVGTGQRFGGSHLSKKGANVERPTLDVQRRI
jgi:hypothetical protein